MRRFAVPLAVIVVALMPADAMADIRFRGETGQGRLATLRTGDDGLVKRFGIAWRAPCRRPGFRYRNATKVLPVYDALTRDRFADADSYRERHPDGIRAVLYARVAGERVSERRWRGVFRMRIRVLRGSRLIDRCYVRTRWRVARRG